MEAPTRGALESAFGSTFTQISTNVEISRMIDTALQMSQGLSKEAILFSAPKINVIPIKTRRMFTTKIRITPVRIKNHYELIRDFYLLTILLDINSGSILLELRATVDNTVPITPPI